jgi:ABC-type glycerol-3-phosphate transport system substrate-binding protein
MNLKDTVKIVKNSFNRKFLKAKLVCCLGAVFFSLFVIHCERSENQDIVLQAFVQPRWTPYLKKAETEWNKTHPQKKIDLQILELGYPQLRNKLITAAGGDNAPDFSLIDIVWIAEFVEAGYLIAIDEFEKAWVDSVFRTDWFESLVNAVSYNNHIYGLVTQTGTEHLYYRRDWFKQEKIQPPKTWNQLIDSANYFQQKSIRNQYGIGDYAMDLLGGIRGGEATTVRWLPVLWSADGEIFNNISDVVFNDSPAQKALQLYFDLVYKYAVVSPQCVTWDWQHPRKLFGAGKIALYIGGSYEWKMLKEQTGWDNQLMKDRIGFVPFPAYDADGQKFVGTGGMAYCIYKQSNHAKLASEFLKLVLSKPLMLDFCIDTNQIPPRKSVAASLDPSKNWFLWENAKLLKWSKSRPTSPIYPKISDQIQLMIELTLSKKTNPQSAVAKTASVIEIEMKK